MLHIRRTLLALVAITLLLATAGPAVAAQRPQPGGFVPIVGQLDGRTGAQLFADSFVPDYVGDSTTPPGECQRLGRGNRVVWLRDVFTCHLRPGDVPVALVGASCSDVEAPPFFAIGEAAQRACDREWNAGLLSMTLPWTDALPSRSPDQRSACHRPTQDRHPCRQSGRLPSGTGDVHRGRLDSRAQPRHPRHPRRRRRCHLRRPRRTHHRGGLTARPQLSERSQRVTAVSNHRVSEIAQPGL
jgi:hypothetical protein